MHNSNPESIWKPIETALDECVAIVRGGDTKMTLMKNKLQWYRYLDPHLKSASAFQLGNILATKLNSWMEHYLTTIVGPSLMMSSNSNNNNNNNNNNSGDGVGVGGASNHDAFCSGVTSSPSPSPLVFRIMKEHSIFTHIIKFASIIFKSMEEVLSRRSHVVPVEERAKRIFAKVILKPDNSQSATVRSEGDLLLNECFSMLNEKRRLGIEHVDEVKAAVLFYISLITAGSVSLSDAQAVYQQRFFDRFLASTHESLDRDATARLAEVDGVDGYVSYAKFRLSTEIAISTQIIAALPETRRKETDIHITSKHHMLLQRVKNTVMDAVVNQRCATLIQDPSYGFQALLADGRNVDLGLLFSLVKDVPGAKGVDLVRLELQKAVEERMLDAKKHLGSVEASTSESGLPNDEHSIHYVFTMITIDLWARGTVKSLLDDTRCLYKVLDEVVKKVFVVEPTTRSIVTGTTSRSVTLHASDLLASFIDVVMRGELQKKQHPLVSGSSLALGGVPSPMASEDDEEVLLDGITHILNALTEKDIFQEHCRVRLAKRLLLSSSTTSTSSSSINEDLEASLLQRMTKLLGKSFTHQMTRMIGDMESTRELCQKFKDDEQFHHKLTTTTGVGQFNAFVLKVGDWPTFKTGGMITPRSLATCIDLFTQFYRRDNALRKLSWCYTLGGGVAAISFTKGIKEVSGTIQQIAILTLLDDSTNGVLSVKELSARLGLTGDSGENFCRSLVQSMSTLSQKFSILHKVDEHGTPITDEEAPSSAASKKASAPTPPSLEDSFAIKKNFVVQVRRFKLPPPRPIVTSASAQQATEAESRAQKLLLAQRNASVDSCIVRVMKSRRRLSFQELSAAVMQQLAKYFPAQPKQIKLRTEELITREYLKRDAQDAAVLEYLA